MDSSHDDADTQAGAPPAAKRQHEPGAFPHLGAALTVKRRAYVLADSQERTWLALDPAVALGGVMQPLLPGQTAEVVAVEEDGLVLRVSSSSGMHTDLDAFLVPRRMVPPAMGTP